MSKFEMVALAGVMGRFRESQRFYDRGVLGFGGGIHLDRPWFDAFSHRTRQGNPTYKDIDWFVSI